MIALPVHLVELCRRRMAVSWANSVQETTVIAGDGAMTQHTPAGLGLLFPGTSGGMRHQSNATATSVRCLSASTPRRTDG